MSYVYHVKGLACLVFVCLGFVVSSACQSRICIISFLFLGVKEELDKKTVEEREKEKILWCREKRRKHKKFQLWGNFGVRSWSNIHIYLLQPKHKILIKSNLLLWFLEYKFWLCVVYMLIAHVKFILVFSRVINA